MEINEIIGKNLSELRKSKGLTQREVAVKLDFSDKSVSKWESGESMPSVDVLVKLAHLFDVKLDYFVTEEHNTSQIVEQKEEPQKPASRYRYSRFTISLLSILFIWVAATCVFVFVQPVYTNIWIVFVWALAASSVMAIIFNSIWGPAKYTFIYISCLIWFTLGAIFLQLVLAGFVFWQLFLLGVPLQIATLLSASLIFKTKKKDPATIRAKREYQKEKALQRKAKKQALLEKKQQQKDKHKKEALEKKEQKKLEKESSKSDKENKTNNESPYTKKEPLTSEEQPTLAEPTLKKSENIIQDLNSPD